MKNNMRPGEKIQIKSVEELLGVVNEEAAMDIEIYKITSFAGHPFKVLDDEKMQELVESIKANGVLSPVLLRPKERDTYEMISGHRRLHAAQLAGLTAIPAIIREMSDDEAVIAMVDANIQREELLPSEKAFAFKMKMDALRHQGSSRLEVEKSDDRWTCEKVGEAGGIGGRQVQRYIRLTELIPEIMSFVDDKKLQISAAVDVSYIDQEIQRWLYEYIKENGTVKPKQITLLREACASGPMTQAKMISILNDSQPGRTPSSKNIISEKKLRDYFPPHYTAADMRDVILELLNKWKAEQEAMDDDL